MSNFFSFLFFINIILLIIGLSRPSVFRKLFKNRVLNRKFILKVFGIPALVLFILIGVIAEPTTNQTTLGNQQKSENQESPLSVPMSATTLNQEEDIVPSTISQAQPATLYPVTQVVDGDTIKVLLNGQTETIRLIGLDTPETVDPRKVVQCFGKEASNKAKELLYGKNVILEADNTQGERDKYDRLLRYVFLEDGTLFNKLMISEGYAHEYTYDSNPYKYQLDFKAAEKEARENSRGLWNSETCAGDTTQAANSTGDSQNITQNNTILAALAVDDGAQTVADNKTTNNNVNEPQVKKSTSDICHEKGTTYYDRTTNYQAFNSIEDCLASGGRLPKR